MKVLGTGPSSAQVLIIGEAPGKEEEARGEPFIGQSGVELTKMIQQVGFLRSECYLDNVCKYRPEKNKITSLFYTKTAANKMAVTPPFILGRFVHEHIAEGVSELEALIDQLKPKLIIALGNTALWATTGEWGITKWRGSNLSTREINGQTYPLLPTYHPSAVLRQWDWRYIAVHDLRQAKRILDNGLPVIQERITIRPNLGQVLGQIAQLKSGADALGRLNGGRMLDVAVDIETRYRQITCVGLAWTPVDAICIPFLEIKTEDKNYWKTLDEETEVVWALRELLTHPNVMIIGQNFLYDQQYFARRMAFVPGSKNIHDTMTAHHVMWAGLPKGLDFLSSFYAQETHVFWKNEGKEWNPKTHDEEQHWIYNARDALRTYIVAKEQRNVYEALNFRSTTYGDPWTIQHKTHDAILRAMLRGVHVDDERKRGLIQKLGKVITGLEEYITFLLGHSLNPRSPKQLSTLFYNDFKVKPVTVYDRATGRRRRTTNADALGTIGKREVLLAPICNAIIDTRGLGTSKSVASQELDIDGRMRCAYSPAMVETYRFNSREDAFGYGTNLQNISSGDENHEPDSPHFRPNLRKMFIPDEGFAICDHDLDQADARVVAWESNCPSLKEIFHDKSRDLHCENADIIFGRHDEPYRQRAKGGVHATNYGATAGVLAAALGITVHEADIFLARYFGERPEVREWHDRIRIELQTRRYVENIFGYRRFYFDRIDNLLKEALAWIPQSTVAIAVNLGILQVQEQLPWAEFLLQVHDSAVHQYPYSTKPGTVPWTEDIEHKFELIRKAMEVPLPYDDPMTIPVSGKWSLESWGHCK